MIHCQVEVPVVRGVEELSRNMVYQNRTFLGFTRPRTYRDAVDLLVTYKTQGPMPADHKG